MFRGSSKFNAAVKYAEHHTPLVVLAGQEYGTGSSRDWAAKGTALLGVKAVVAQSFERIHRSNLVGMGVLPLQFNEGANAQTLKLEGTESYDVLGLGSGLRPQQELIQIDTTDILFICCGAFNGLEDIVRRRTGQRGLGFGAQVSTAEDDKDALRRQARTEDLIKFGMIPEFMGRLPVIVSCDALDVEALTEVLWKPRNALAKQYHRLFELEGVKLNFRPDALTAIAEEAARRNSGARGLRAILEEVMLDVMYEIPSLTGVSECVVTRDVVVSRGRPQLVREKKAS